MTQKKDKMTLLINRFLEARKTKWSASTLRTIPFRLKGVTMAHLQSPQKLYDYLSKERGLSRYTLNTTYINIADFAEFLVDEGELEVSRLKKWKADNANLFKHAYTKKRVDISFAEALEKINQIDVADIRAKCLQLLATGMRYTESETLEDGQVVGKGGYVRTVPNANQFKADDFTKTYGAVYKQLKKVGLTPHMLRKICATEHAKDGASEADLMNIFGWRNSTMAHMYVQARRTEELAERLAKKMNKGRKK